jgi:hypothetical protein
MSPQIIEILSPNLPSELKQYRDEQRWCAYINPEQPGDLMSYPEAVREAIALGIEGCVGYVEELEPQAAVVPTPDYSEPVPSYLSRRKRTKLNLIQPKET